MKFKQFLSEIRLFSDYTVHKSKEFDGSHRYEVRHKGKIAGFSTLDTGNKKIFYTIIKPEHQRKGVATALYKHIEKSLGRPLEPSDQHTAMGKAFRKKYEARRTITEMFDSHYPYMKTHEKKGSNYSFHEYSFRTPNDKYHVKIDNNEQTKRMNVSFHNNSGSQGISGKEGKNSHRIFGTIQHIMNNHAEEHDIKHARMYGAYDTEGRNRLYTHILKNKPKYKTQDVGDGIIHTYDIPKRTLREILSEAEDVSDMGIKHNATPNHLKALAKKDPYGEARFVIHPDNKIMAARSYDYTHSDLAPSNDYHNSIQGFIHHNHLDNTHSYIAYKGVSSDEHPSDHPVLAKFRKAGISSDYKGNSHRYTDDEDYDDEETNEQVAAGESRLREGLLDKENPQIHNNIGIAQLKGIAKTHGAARFVISPDNKLHGGSAHHYVHDNIYNSYVHHGSYYGSIYGFMYHNSRKDEYKYHSYTLGSTPNNHPILKSMRDIHHIKFSSNKPKINILETHLSFSRKFDKRDGTFIKESRSSEKIHYNISIPHLKALTKNSLEGHIRFVVDKDNKLHGAEPMNFNHYDIDREPKIRGMIFHNFAGHVGHSFIANHGWSGRSLGKGHPFEKEMNKHGISLITNESNKGFVIRESMNITEITKKLVMKYLNKAQDKPERMFSSPDKTLKSYTLAQKKLGIAQKVAKIRATGRINESIGEDKVHINLGIGTLKHMAKNIRSKTMKFYISSSQPDANMYSGDSQFYTHHSLGARASQIQGAITHHPDTDSYHYQAWKSENGKNVEASHSRLEKMEKLGVTRGKWNSDEARVEKS